MNTMAGGGRIALLASVVVALAGCGLFWRSPGYTTGVAPDAVRDAVVSNTAPNAGPDFVRADSVSPANGAVLVIGVRHTKDPNDAQIAHIRKEWAAFRPTVALVEGRLGFLMRGMDPVKRHGESGATAALAKGAGIPLYTWEPTRADEARMLLARHPAQRVALYLTLRPYFSNYRFGPPKNPDDFVDGTRKSRTELPGLEGTLPSVATIDSMWAADFAGKPDWRKTSDEYGLPGYLDTIAVASSRARDEHLIGIVHRLTARGERVFVTVGRSHVPKLAPAILRLGH